MQYLRNYTTRTVENTEVVAQLYYTASLLTEAVFSLCLMFDSDYGLCSEQ